MDEDESESLDCSDTAKLQMINPDATATLALQSFSASLNKDGIESSTSTDEHESHEVFETIDIDPASITGFLQPDGQFLPVEGITAVDTNIYLTSDARESLTYIVSHAEDNTIDCETSVSGSSGRRKAVHEELIEHHDDNMVDESDTYIDPSTLLAGHQLIKYPTRTAATSLLTTNRKPAVSLLHALNVSPSNSITTTEHTVSTSQDEKEHHSSSILRAPTISLTDPNRGFQTVTIASTASDCSGDATTNTYYMVLIAPADESSQGSLSTSSGNLLQVNEETTSVTSATKEPTTMTVNTSFDTGELAACCYCNYTTTKRYLLVRHMKIHSDERPHKCPICEHSFKTHAALTNHVNTHSGIRPHKCKCCDSAFTTSGELIRHIRYKHTFEKPHKCTQCDYASVELSKMKRHMRTHTGERPYHCDQCSYASPDSYKLKRHMRIHTGEKPYECDICSARFTQSNSLKAHKLIHTGNKPVFQCELCPATCGRRTDLKVHKQKLHSREKVPPECRKCHRTFPDRYSYKLHMKCHEGERTFKCGLCEFATITENRLIDHLIIQHDNHKPYTCPVDSCEAAFRYKSLLKRHKIFVHRTEGYHPSEKLYECTCGKRFCIESNQAKHEALHDGSIPLNSIAGILTDLEDIDEINEELVAEINEEIINSNNMLHDVPALILSTSTASDSYNCKHEDMVMRRIIQEVDGHRVVVMEVGPRGADNQDNDTDVSNNVSLVSQHDHVNEALSASVADDHTFDADHSIAHDSGVQILYSLAAHSHHQEDDDPHHHQQEMDELSPSHNVVTLHMDEDLADSVIAKEVHCDSSSVNY